jgi:hypothetical protein
LKPIYATLRERGHISSGYIDDSYLQGDTYLECRDNGLQTAELFTALGLWIHEEKSVFIPTQRLLHLGNVFDSTKLTVELSETNKSKLIAACRGALQTDKLTIRSVAQLIGLMVSSIPAVQFGDMYYRQLEIEKAAALKCHKGNFEHSMKLSSLAQVDINWWILNIPQAYQKISRDLPQSILRTDASMSGWGAATHDCETGGRWTMVEAQAHINVLELKAAFLGLKALCNSAIGTHIHLQMDNTTAVAHVNAKGGSHSKGCNSVSRLIWEWCITKDIWLSASHLAGVLNVQADTNSRVFHDQTEWKLDSRIFQEIVKLSRTPQIDMFASRLNYQVEPYIAWMPDPWALAIDAFSISWKDYYIYAFPPFSLLNRVLQRMRKEEVEGIIVAPSWTTQTWYPLLGRMSVQPPMEMPWTPHVLTLPYKEGAHPLGRELRLKAWFLSGKRRNIDILLNVPLW